MNVWAESVWVQLIRFTSCIIHHIVWSDSHPELSVRLDYIILRANTERKLWQYNEEQMELWQYRFQSTVPSTIAFLIVEETKLYSSLVNHILSLFLPLSVLGAVCSECICDEAMRIIKSQYFESVGNIYLEVKLL